MPARTLSRQTVAVLNSQRDALFADFASRNIVWVHWCDNFARHYASNAMHFNKDLFHSLLWSAHGAKMLPPSLSIDIDISEKDMSALPSLDRVLDKRLYHSLLRMLSDISIHQFEHSFSRSRNITRVPIKASPLGPTEIPHYHASHDGLSSFFPADIYEDNIQSKYGMLKILAHVLKVCGVEVRV